VNVIVALNVSKNILYIVFGFILVVHSFGLCSVNI